jgi:hypothetical protein
VVNTSAGAVFRLTATADGWEKVGESKAKRKVARLVPRDETRVLLVGGAGDNPADVEVIKLAEKGELVAAEVKK